MNKELILKYKKEFDHWLNEGKLLGKYDYTNVISNYKQEPWFELQDDKWNSENQSYLLIVINDEYVEFRKALAEGKTIQYYECVHQHETCDSLDKYDWIDWKSANPSVSFSNTLMYRIKPEEPKFKVGDWVKDFEKIYQIKTQKEADYLNSKDYCGPSTSLWKPERGEYCWFWTPAQKSIPKLGKFLQMERHNQYYASFGDSNYSCESNLYCEPFIGQLPTYIKSKI